MSLAIFFFFKILLTYSGGREGGSERGGEREKEAPCKEPAMGPDPGSLGSRPEPKPDAQRTTSHQASQSLLLIDKEHLRLNLNKKDHCRRGF